ncbi:GNAT family N-acetyltransferase, partial [Streptomyces anulatus]|uniref:GNAT family N-acetyltransferase n=1 Tax=Streptomyces anulatus TaxID=1892 RepID=UPI003D9E15DB
GWLGGGGGGGGPGGGGGRRPPPPRQGANRITLRVLAHNDPARALYASEGFAVEGVFPGEFFLNGRYVDDVCMGRSLGPA